PPTTAPTFTTAPFSPLPPPATTGTGTFPSPSVEVSAASPSPTNSSAASGETTTGPQPSPSPGLVAGAIDATPPSQTRRALPLVVVLGLFSLLIGPALLMLARKPEPAAKNAGKAGAAGKAGGIRRTFSKLPLRRKRAP